MKYYTILPPPVLSGYVRFFWVLEGGNDDGTPYVYRSMADGCAEMIFHYNGVFDELDAPPTCTPAYSMVHAQSQRFRRFQTRHNFGIFGVYLYPFSIPQLFSVPSSDITNHMPDLESLLGKEGKELEEKMMVANNNSQRLQILCAFLEKRILLKRNAETRMHSSVRYVIDSKGILNVKQLAEQFCLSTRQFERKFKELAGFSPKMYSRIVRFQSSLREQQNKGRLLTDIAYACGYYDQSHFISDFREFSGYHPKQYFSGKPEGAEFRDL